MPIGDLTNIGNTLRTLGAASTGTRDAGLAGLRVAEERKILEESRRVAQETEARKLVDGTLKSILAKSMGSVKDDVTLGQRRQKRDSIVVLMKQMKIPNEVIAQTVSEMSRTPLAQSVEDKAKIALGVTVGAEQRDAGTARSKTLFDSATFRSQKEFTEHLKLTGKEDNSLLVVKPKTTIIRPGSKVVDAAGNLVFENPKDPNSVRRSIGIERKEASEKEWVRVKGETEGSNLRSDRILRARARIIFDANRFGLGPSYAREGLKDINSRFSNLDKFFHTYDAVSEILKDKPGAITTGGVAAGQLVSIVSNAKGLVDLIPGVDPQIRLEYENYSKELLDLANGNQRISSAMYSLAMMNAMAEGLTTGRLSNFQIKQQMKNVGADAKNPQAIEAKLLEVGRRVDNALNRALDVHLESFTSANRSMRTHRDITVDGLETNPDFAIIIRERADAAGMSLDEFLDSLDN